MTSTLQTVAIVLGAAMLAATVVLVRHRWFPMPPEAEPREDVAEYIAMMVGVLYALVLGVSLVSVWDTNNTARTDVRAEASALHQTALLAVGLPAEQRQQLQEAAGAYARNVVDSEWPRMAAGRGLGTEGWQLLDQLRGASVRSAAATPGQQATVQELLAQLSTLDDARRGREADAQRTLSPILWAGLIIGGVVTVLFMFLFGIRRSFTHLAMVMGLTALITFVILLIYQLNTPFANFFAVSPAPFTRYFPGAS